VDRIRREIDKLELDISHYRHEHGQLSEKKRIIFEQIIQHTSSKDPEVLRSHTSLSHSYPLFQDAIANLENSIRELEGRKTILEGQKGAGLEAEFTEEESEFLESVQVSFLERNHLLYHDKFRQICTRNARNSKRSQRRKLKRRVRSLDWSIS